jgi:spore germination protein YaaH
MFESVFSKLRPIIAALILMLALALCLTSRTWIGAPANYFWQTSTIQTLPAPSVSTSRLLNGKLASLGWIVGRDCQRGIRAYLQTASTNPDAALVGTGWVDPTSGKLIDGESNNCVPGSLSMDNVVQLVHSKGGMAYLTITMETDGTAGSWTSQQQSVYIAKATTDQSYIDTIVHEVTRANYDGVIMDMEGANRTYPNIQQLFATYNQRVWAALKPLHKLYGIALIHKLSNQDDYYNLNGFENWSLLAHCADFIVIMAVDQSYFTPGPTVSIPWLKQLLAYALHTMPAMLPHIIWELPLYGATWHWDGSNWVFDGGANYQDAQVLAGQIPASEIDTSSSNLNDPYAAHIVYTDTSGVKHALWYHTAKNLYRIITEFQRILEQVPQFNHSHLQIAVWYRATWEPGDLWAMLDPVLSN